MINQQEPALSGGPSGTILRTMSATTCRDLPTPDPCRASLRTRLRWLHDQIRGAADYESDQHGLVAGRLRRWAFIAFSWTAIGALLPFRRFLRRYQPDGVALAAAVADGERTWVSEGPDAAIRKLRDVADGLASSKKLFAKIAPYGRFHAVADWVRLQDYLFEWELSAGRPARARAVAEHMVKLSRGKDESWLERWARARDAAGAKGDA